MPVFSLFPKICSQISGTFDKFPGHLRNCCSMWWYFIYHQLSSTSCTFNGHKSSISLNDGHFSWSYFILTVNVLKKEIKLRSVNNAVLQLTVKLSCIHCVVLLSEQENPEFEVDLDLVHRFQYPSTAGCVTAYRSLLEQSTSNFASRIRSKCSQDWEVSVVSERAGGLFEVKSLFLFTIFQWVSNLSILQECKKSWLNSQ